MSTSMHEVGQRPSTSSTERAVAFLAIALLFLALFGSLLTAGFYVVEDHTLFRRGASALSDWLTRVAFDARGFGRFRPLYQLYVVLSFAAYGANASLWHAAALFWGVITCYLLYLAIRMVGADIVSATLFVLMLVLSGGQNWIWINLVPAETSGMVLTAIATLLVVLSSRRAPSWRWHIPVLTSLALMGLAKESFVILIPALLMLRVLCHKGFSGQAWLESAKALTGLLVGGVLVFVALMGAIAVVLISTPGGYGSNAAGLSQTGSTLNAIGALVTAISASVRWTLVGAVPLLALLWLEPRRNRGILIACLVTVAMWLGPQVLLYRNGLQERYLFPFVVGLAAAVALALSDLRRSSRAWPLSYVGMLALFIALGVRVSATTSTVGWFVAETRSSNRMVQFLAQNIAPTETILMAGDSGTAYGYEATYSLPAYLKGEGSSSPFYLWPLEASGGRSPMHVEASRNNAAFKFPETLRPADVGAIVVVDQMVPPLDLAPLRAWLGPSNWREVSFSEPITTFSWRRLRTVRTGDATHRVLLTTQSRHVPSLRPLITVDNSLSNVEVGQVLETPPWGLEPDYAGPGSILWLGQGEAEDLGWTLTSPTDDPVVIDAEIVPGPSRSDYRRNVELAIDSASGHQVLRRTFDAGRWSFDVRLTPGPNRIHMTVLDQPTVAVQPNGDTRHLLALVRRLTVRRSAMP